MQKRFVGLEWRVRDNLSNFSIDGMIGRKDAKFALQECDRALSVTRSKTTTYINNFISL